jgi:hypothetical protein
VAWKKVPFAAWSVIRLLPVVIRWRLRAQWVILLSNDRLMKKYFILLVMVLGIGIQGWAQQKVVRYCVLLTRPKKTFSTTRMVVELQSGDHQELFAFRDTLVMAQLRKVTELETMPDLLNYMSGIGWTFAGPYGSIFGIFVFKREFDVGELASPGIQAP